MTPAGLGPMELLLMLGMYMFGVGALPVSVPPLPPDPVVQRAAPDECLFYLSTSGMAVPDAASKNETEKLLAHSEVQQFVGEVGGEILKVIRAKSAGDPNSELLAAELPAVLYALATRPMSL